MTPNPEFAHDSARASAVARIFQHFQKNPDGGMAGAVSAMARAGDTDLLSDLLDANILQNPGFNDMKVGYGILPLLEARGARGTPEQVSNLVDRWLVAFECDDVRKMSDFLQFVEDEPTTRALLARGANPNENMSRLRGPLPIIVALEHRENDVPWLMLKALKEREQVPMYQRGKDSIFRAMLQDMGALGGGRGVDILSRMEDEGLPDVWREAMGHALCTHKSNSNDPLLGASLPQGRLHVKMLSLAKIDEPDLWRSLFDPKSMMPEGLVALTMPGQTDFAIEAFANVAKQGVDMDRIIVKHLQMPETTLLHAATYHRNPVLMQVLLDAGCDPYRTCKANMGGSSNDTKDLNAFQIAELRFSAETVQVLNAWKANEAIKNVLFKAGKTASPQA